MRLRPTSLLPIVGLAIVAGCGGDGPASGGAFDTGPSPPPPTASPLPVASLGPSASGPSTTGVGASEATLETAAVATGTSPPTESSVTTTAEEVVHAVDDAFAVTLPSKFDELRPPRVERNEGTELVSLSFGDTPLRARVIITMTRGQDAAVQLAVGDPEATERVTFTGTRPEGDVLAWTDPMTGQRALAWAADAVTVMWVFGNGMSDDELKTIVGSIEVANK